MHKIYFRKIFIFLSFFITGIIIGAEPNKGVDYTSKSDENTIPPFLGKIGEFPFPTNPMNDRAKGFLLEGKVKNAVTNYGNYITWDEHPAGLWGEYTNLPHVAFVGGVPGQKYSSEFFWEKCLGLVPENDDDIEIDIWCSHDAYSAWYAEYDTNFVGIIFDSKNDCGNPTQYNNCGLWRPDSVSRVDTPNDVSEGNQWGISDSFEWGDDVGVVFLSLERSIYDPIGLDPNESSARIGLIYPWALRPSLKERTDEFDIYNYGPDKEEWTQDDVYEYYGANVAESWFTRWNPTRNTDWHASTMARTFTHNLELTAGDLFGDTPFTDANDTYPLLAHSKYIDTWPVEYNTETGLDEPHWPGWFAEDYDVTLSGCDGSRLDPDCWKTTDRFISDNDVYMEFDDRWTHRANLLKEGTTDIYEQTGYPMGLRIMSAAHSYGVSFAEDIMFVTVRVKNESGDWTDEDGFHDGMIMPDGTKLNHGKGFNYKGLFLGFYMDADVVSADINGNFGVHTNADDFMKYIDCKTSTEYFPHGCPDIKGDTLRVSMAVIGDYDGRSGIAQGYAFQDGTNIGHDFGLVATQLLDSPLATDKIDLDQDGSFDIYPGEKLKMTDWHWFDWYNRPGVVTRESNTNCCAGGPGRSVARNREEINLKVISGDTVNLTADEKTWFFHTENPTTDADDLLNPHFDSLDGIEQEDVFDGGLDCVLIMSCGPLDLNVGEEVPFSFCIIFGENEEDLINNAKFAQVMYNNHYQGFTPPTKPSIAVVTDHNKVTIYWDDAAENSTDVVTAYADFEGYKIYKSTDGGATWGSSDKMIFDDNGVHVGWRPFAQFDLSAEEDSLHCIFENDDCGDEGRGRSILGPDPNVPWFSLGSNTGFGDILMTTPIDTVLEVLNDKSVTLTYSFIDTNVIDGMEYTYAVTAYDMGVEADYVITWDPVTNGFLPDTVYSKSNPDNWASPEGYQHIETSKGTTIHDPNFKTVIPGSLPQDDLTKIRVVPNPYLVRSKFKESEFARLIRFTNLPALCTITIFTVTGEKVITLDHDSVSDGNYFWNLRTINNQEIAPGLYLFAVETKTDKHIGKFAIVR
ncbi:MAG TPA: hypothetical protein QF355_06735 [Candidatus Marinimicrobia bacterium]|jgi:hypothetical protein|nr:hypothetical protein [Candidatus Neomarinimicrobiota bacterium]MDP6260512.1 hypothetical protein [Candidatus Neomarinimicrobiota bacterium]MDP7336621.1 hypothetical protein [Candidatus Neomarinimicrobiota bacterium]MDP7465008.1 hypothetical protein [Candidatus Neomarinimicrobiota bacterium]MDP7526904.1 hypothetical protein [Candidatus Neomarinimicrobiota bacterium]|tara:strand:- start:18 stop:3254 length:3237 start_codon:yes stop_codon:yes gene_type:complete